MDCPASGKKNGAVTLAVEEPSDWASTAVANTTKRGWKSISLAACKMRMQFIFADFFDQVDIRLIRDISLTCKDPEVFLFLCP